MMLNLFKYKQNWKDWISFCFHFIIFVDGAVQKIERNSLSDSILHFEPLNYHQNYLYDGHNRVRRSLNPKEELQLNFRAHNRNFKLRLQRDVKLFTHGADFGDIANFHLSNIYEGFLHGDDGSRVHGFIHDNIFEGRIHCGDGNEFHIESTKQYKHLDPKNFHSVIYNVKDIIHPKQHKCGGIKADTQEWMNKQLDRTVWENETGVNNYIKFGSHEPDVKVNHHRERRAASVPKTECQLLMRADWTYVKWAESAERAMYLMTQHVKSVSHIYQFTDFDNKAGVDQYTLNIRRIGVINVDNCAPGDTTTQCKFKPKNIGVEKFLDLSSLDNHDAYCLSYVFAHRDFSDGVLGLAWIGDSSGAGGICDRYQSISGIMKSLNTGIVTNLNYGKDVASKVSDITLAHEIGHNFGSQHDPTTGVCAPGGDAGNFVMYPRATSGSNRNNYNFSSCSKAFIAPVLRAKSSICFQPRGSPICGNRIVEAEEECDCGYANEDTCKVRDKCCTGALTGGGGCKFSDIALNIEPSKRCSPSSGTCCDPGQCKPYANTTRMVCSAESECSQAATCIDTSAACPAAAHRPDDCSKSELPQDCTKCNNGSNLCVQGQCSGSLCLLKKQVECQCTATADLCNLCCQQQNQSSTCNMYKSGSNSGAMKLPPGSPCEQYKGYCDILNKCRQVDAEGPLSRLKKFLFSSKTLDTILEWMKTHWWACILIGLGLVLFMAGFIACCSVHTPSSNPNKPPPRPVTLPRALSRHGNRNARPSAPPSSQRSGGYRQQPPPERPPDYVDNTLPGYNTAVRDNHHQPPSYGGSMEMR